MRMWSCPIGWQQPTRIPNNQSLSRTCFVGWEESYVYFYFIENQNSLYWEKPFLYFLFIIKKMYPVKWQNNRLHEKSKQSSPLS